MTQATAAGVRESSYVGPCHVVSSEMAVAIENSVNCKVQRVIHFLQVDEILGYLSEESNSRVELFCCTTMHVHILPGRHKPCCVSNSIGTSSSILRTVRTWHRRTFSYLKKLMSTWLINTSQGRPEECCRRPHDMTRVYTNWCQGTTSAFNVKGDYVE